jgi:hypothetical protein
LFTKISIKESVVVLDKLVGLIVVKLLWRLDIVLLLIILLFLLFASLVWGLFCDLLQVFSNLCLLLVTQECILFPRGGILQEGNTYFSTAQNRVVSTFDELDVFLLLLTDSGWVLQSVG